jgi:hypothetical protein
VFRRIVPFGAAKDFDAAKDVFPKSVSPLIFSQGDATKGGELQWCAGALPGAIQVGAIQVGAIQVGAI